MIRICVIPFCKVLRSIQIALLQNVILSRELRGPKKSRKSPVFSIFKIFSNASKKILISLNNINKNIFDHTKTKFAQFLMSILKYHSFFVNSLHLQLEFLISNLIITVRHRYSSACWPQDACTMTSHHSRDKQATVAPDGHCRHGDWAHSNSCGIWCASRPMLSLIRWRVICGRERVSGKAEEESGGGWRRS